MPFGSVQPIGLGMLLQLGCHLTIAVAGWLALSALVGRSHTGRATPALTALGAIGGVWAVGELLLLSAATSADLVLARRVVYGGACALPPVWLWLALCTGGPRDPGRRRRAIALAFVVPVIFYSRLYWDASGWFLDWSAPDVPMAMGPGFDLFLAHQYALLLAGTAILLRTALRLGHTSRSAKLALVGGIALPMAADAAWVMGWVAQDWTAATLGPAGVLLWIAIVESGITSRLPIARHEVIEQLDVGVVVADLEGRIVSVNAAAARLADVPDMRGRSIGEVVASAQQRHDAVIEARGIPLRGRFGMVGHALILTDRTDSETSRRRLELAGRLEALGSLTAGIAHEVNNPLAYVQANLSALDAIAKTLAAPAVRERLEGAARDDVGELAPLIEETREGVERIRLLVLRLKNFSRSPDLSGRTHEIDLADTVRQAAAVASVGLDGDPIRVEVEPDLRIVTLETAVFQILVNVLLNAVQAAPQTPDIEVRLCARGDGVAIDVADDGPGIPDSVLPRIFDPFFTTKSMGTGLGLSLSYELAQQAGGRLEAANREGGGAVFTLWLPRRPSAPGDAGERSAVA